MALFRRAGAKVVEYAKNVGNDYATVVRETAKESKERPVRTAIALSVVGGIGYAFCTNPTLEDLKNALAEKRQELVLIPNPIQNPDANTELRKRTELVNQNRLDYYDLFLCSLVVARDHDSKASLYATQDPNLRKWIWNEIWDNLVDVGAFGKFHNLEKSFIDCDVNASEFPAEEKASS